MPRQNYDSYMICTTPRSGSTFLCKLLSLTKVAGVPDSHFHAPSLTRWMEAFGLEQPNGMTKTEALNAVFSAARDRGTGGTGHFGLRMQRESFDYFMQQANHLFPQLKSDVARIHAAFGRTLFIHLTRPNKVDQAISLLKARQTGLWHKAADGTELQRLSKPREPHYDGIEIARLVADLTVLDRQWDAWFAREGIAPLSIQYDDLARTPSGTLAIILAELGQDTSVANTLNAPTAILSDEINRAWAKRYRAENAI